MYFSGSFLTFLLMLRSMSNLAIPITIFYHFTCRAWFEVTTTLFALAAIGAHIVGSRHDGESLVWWGVCGCVRLMLITSCFYTFCCHATIINRKSVKRLCGDCILAYINSNCNILDACWFMMEVSIYVWMICAWYVYNFFLSPLLAAPIHLLNTQCYIIQVET